MFLLCSFKANCISYFHIPKSTTSFLLEPIPDKYLFINEWKQIEELLYCMFQDKQSTIIKATKYTDGKTYFQGRNVVKIHSYVWSANVKNLPYFACNLNQSPHQFMQI